MKDTSREEQDPEGQRVNFRLGSMPRDPQLGGGGSLKTCT